jgi:hypothetical protein
MDPILFHYSSLSVLLFDSVSGRFMTVFSVAISVHYLRNG